MTADDSPRTLRVLVVDDHALNLELASFLLQAHGLAVETAATADEAMAHIRQQPPDGVLMDIQLPGTDGLVLTRRLKADPATSHIVVIAFTAYAMKGDEEKMRDAGCDGYISKPIDVATFASTVSQLLGAPRPEAAG